MWAGSIVLRIGERRDLLVAVQADDEATLELLHTLFGRWAAAGVSDDGVTLRPAFGIRLGPAGGEHRSGAPREVPQLRFGSKAIARSRQADDVVRSLAQVLGGAHLQRRDDGRAWVAMRPFARGAAAVLVAAEPPTMVNDPRLARAGIDELMAWSVVVDADRSIGVPPPLPRLNWGAVGVDPPPSGWQRFDLAGIVTQDDRRPTDRALLAELIGRGAHGQWSDVVGSLADGGRIAPAPKHVALRAAVERLLGA